jgi:hypothetical protein
MKTSVPPKKTEEKWEKRRDFKSERIEFPPLKKRQRSKHLQGKKNYKVL